MMVKKMDKSLALEFVRVTEAAAIASARWMGRGDGKKADQAATEEMRRRFNYIEMDGFIVIGEGERDNAPMLYIGEEVGTKKGMKIDIAVDPLECTDSVAFGKPNAISVLAAAPRGTMLHAPDVYMDKIVTKKGNINLDASVQENLQAVAEAKDMDIKDLMVCVMDRKRNEKLIKEIRESGAKISLIQDGDISGGISACMDNTEIDILMGVGAAPEGVITAAAVNCIGGEMETRLKFINSDGSENKETRERAIKMGLKNLDGKRTAKDLVNTDRSLFVATGISSGPFLKGVEFNSDNIITHSVVMRQKSKTIRFIEGHHKTR